MTWVWVSGTFIFGLTTIYFAYVAMVERQMKEDYKAGLDQLHESRNQFLLDVLEKAEYKRYNQALNAKDRN